MSIPTGDESSVPKVTGIGGIFFRTADQEKVQQWYHENLGLTLNPWGGATLQTRDVDNPEQINKVQWKPFKEGDEYFAPSNREYMVNYRVQNLEALLVKLRQNGVVVLDQVQTFSFGKFVHILDGEGTKLELWEPS